ncbi:FadR/GntR family transcriptional regulator [Microbulbifer sp. 2205BS26-8]|uniref:FadR/GntR family transcriptional regulator n=1 Tax=Microbulbifer sp. 2205BS26-8 TaxID=3064386 RepID=UPI00273DDD75|nr:FadR/GntR family transcriptional regulator [Microbulbifer sp. 2205BS26-8]MDP5210798.1 FadR/GntR family transcriptional regulator [Microbulbifer sp. 2205BS26-8]
MTQKKFNLTQSILDTLGKEIVAGKYANDRFPVESELCARFDASRSVLREAVKMLTSKGLLHSRQRKGTDISPEEHWSLLDPDILRWLLESKPSLALLQEFMEIRLSIEPQAAAYAAERANKDQIAKILHALERMKAAEERQDDPLEPDIQFHTAILEASNNRFFIQLEELVRTALTISIHVTNELKGVRTANVADHKKVLDFILIRDADAAYAEMKILLSGALKLIKEAHKDTLLI